MCRTGQMLSDLARHATGYSQPCSVPCKTGSHVQPKKMKWEGMHLVLVARQPTCKGGGLGSVGRTREMLSSQP